MARPYAVDLTPELIELASEGYRQGKPIKDVAADLGVHLRTLQRWLAAGDAELLRRGEAPEAPPSDDPRLEGFVTLAAAVRQAHSRFISENLLLIRRAGVEGKTVKTVTRRLKDGTELVERTETIGGNWTALAWLLERRSTEDFGRQIRQLEVSGELATGPAISREERADRLAGWLEGFQAGVDAQASAAAARAEQPEA